MMEHKMWSNFRLRGEINMKWSNWIAVMHAFWLIHEKYYDRYTEQCDWSASCEAGIVWW